MTVLRPGETCWRLARAGRAAFLMDNQAYYAALFAALLAARRSVLILGWAFDPRTRLAPDGSEGPADPDEIGRILVGLTQSRPDLDVRLLIWKSAFSTTGVHPFLRHRARTWFARTAVKFHEDGDVPFGACHHQKVVVIDDRVAFCGGGDIVTNRWDTPAHLQVDPRRILPHHAPHPPRHEVMMLVDGEAAAALGDLFRTRWRNAAQQEPAPVASVDATDPWPASAPVSLRDVDVAIARTQPRWKGRPLVDEIRQLTLACIANATHTIYLENQYFTSHVVTEALAERLVEPDGPEVILIITRQAPSWFDQVTMDQGRNPMVRRLRAADRFCRFRALAPRTSAGQDILLHAKVSVFDDRIVRVGSANLNDRSGGFDTECELAVEGDDPAASAAIARFRDRLLGHFLAVAPTDVAEAHRSLGSLVKAIDTLNVDHRLAPIATGKPTWWEAFVAAHHLGDPSDAGESWRLRGW
jgi:phosphatidylserine/phosphatidylglycerophosphate/cardiolipin synthase-like enzyme